MIKFTLLPRTGLGKFSAGALILFAFALLFRILQSEIEALHTVTGDILAILFFFMEYLAGAVAWLSGLIAIFKNKERSILVLAYTLVPLAAIVFILVSDLLR